MTLSRSNSALAYPRRDGGVTRRSFDQSKLIVSQSKVYGVAARVACRGSSARSLGFHVNDITVKQKRLASPELMLYDKDMTKRTIWITFHTDKNGKRYATQFFQGRNFRIALAEAELLIATGAGVEEAEVKW